MKCPKCKGTKIERFVSQNPWAEKGDIPVPCPHCDGTGEIKKGDVWMCDIYEVGQCYTTGRTVEAYLECTVDGWISGQYLYQISWVTPRARFKEVK